MSSVQKCFQQRSADLGSNIGKCFRIRQGNGPYEHALFTIVLILCTIVTKIEIFIDKMKCDSKPILMDSIMIFDYLFILIEPDTP